MRGFAVFLAGGLTAVAMASAQAAVPVASYSFNGTLAADQAGAPTLTAIDPQGANGFETALVGGVSRTVYRWIDVAGVNQHGGGLQFSALGLLTDPQSYALALNFEFTGSALAGGGWRRIVDTQARQSDNGFYVSPTNKLQTVRGTDTGIDVDSNALVSGVTTFTTPGFHTVWLQVQGLGDGHQQVQAWLDGQLELSTTTSRFGLNNASNPNGLLVFFADNLAAGAQQEYGNGRIASLALYDGALSPLAVPEPQAALLLSAGLAVLALLRQRRRHAPARR
jgi:hypothetical protein